MKFTPEVIAALQTLKNAAENDFETHRISVLEKDLTAPPKVEIIDETRQKFNGAVYGENTKGHFQKSVQIHRAVYAYYNGEIPEGYEIHHIDENKANNDISNLQMLTKAEHHQVHGNPLIVVVCPTCGKTFQTKRKKAKFCSISCAAKMQYKGHSVDKTCPICGKIFHTRNSMNRQCCSLKCYNEFRKIQKPKTCPICGKIMERKTGAICCSRSCGGKLAGQTRRKNLKSGETLMALNIDSVATTTNLVSTFLNQKTP